MFNAKDLTVLYNSLVMYQEHMVNESKELSKLMRLRASKPQGFCCIVDADGESKKVEKGQKEFIAYLDELKDRIRKMQMLCPLEEQPI